ncbi:MAG: hypothetical protein K1X78_28410 [Verrucomicrobiaceae bacterium]|nr:hypothetical protein [Verrucomicrobiaceae bacterium]
MGFLAFGAHLCAPICSLIRSIGNLSSLTSLDLRNNQLTSTIPGSVGNLSALISLDLSLNQLSGSIPSSLGNLATLTHLFLGGNQLTGLIPGSFGTLSELLNLSLESNQLTGLIPSSLGGLGMLEVLSLADNQLTGPIPASLGDLGSLQYLSLAGNQLTGSIPASLGNLTALMSLDLSSNLLTGAIPASLGDLYAPSIDLAYNRLSDRVPLGVIALWPDLSHNYITLDSQQRLDFIMSGMPDEYWMPQDIPNITLEPFGSGLQIDAEGYPYWNKAAFFPTLDAFLKVTNDEDTGPIVFTLESQSDWLTIREFSVGSPPAAQVATVKLQAYGSTVFELSINLPSGSPCGTYVSEIKVLPGAFGEEPVTIPVTFYYSTQFVPLVTNGFNHKPVEGATLQVTGPLSFTAVTQANGMPWLTPVWLQGTYHYTATAPGNLASDPLNPSMGYVAGNVGVWSEVQLFEHDAPVGGTMSINEASPLKPNSELNVVLRNWTDVSAPLSYEIEIDGKIVSAKGASLGRILLTPDDPGAHTIKGRIYDAGNNVAEVTQTFTVSALPPEAPPRSAYMSSPGAAFRPYFFGTTSNTGNAADNADPDHDGHSNLLEWALMLDPTRPSTLPAVTNGIGGSPASFNALNAAATTTGGGLEFLYVRNATATAAGAVFIVEWTDTMGPLDWHTAGVTQTILSDNGAVQQVLATIPAGTGTQRFVRLRVTGPP